MGASVFSPIISLRILACASLLGLSSCAWFSNPKPTEESAATAPATTPAGEVTNESGQTLYVTKADFTPLYRSGPQQPGGPDQSLPKDTLVALLKKGFGYSRVQLDGGLDGYVATEDLQLAPPERVAPPPPVPSNSAIVSRYTVDNAERSAATSTSNAEALPDLPEPILDSEPILNPESAPLVKPEFRY